MPPMPRGMGIGFELTQQLARAALTIEIIYAFILIAISLIIFFSTKELYSLTKHKGIKYFRYSFLFFALAFFFRSFIKIFVFFIQFPQKLNSVINFLLQYGTYFLFIYFSSLAIFYLVYSIKYKQWDNEKTSHILFNTIAGILALIVVLTDSLGVVLAINIAFLLAILFVIISPKEKKNKSLHIIYVLLFIFWILNVIDIFIPSFLQFYQLITYLASIGIFLSMLYKVLTSVGSN